MDWASFGVEPISMIGVDALRLFQKQSVPRQGIFEECTSLDQRVHRWRIRHAPQIVMPLPIQRTGRRPPASGSKGHREVHPGYPLCKYTSVQMGGWSSAWMVGQLDLPLIFASACEKSSRVSVGGDSPRTGLVFSKSLLECRPSLVDPRQPEGAATLHPSYGFSKHRREALRSWDRDELRFPQSEIISVPSPGKQVFDFSRGEALDRLDRLIHRPDEHDYPPRFVGTDTWSGNLSVDESRRGACHCSDLNSVCRAAT